MGGRAGFAYFLVTRNHAEIAEFLANFNSQRWHVACVVGAGSFSRKGTAMLVRLRMPRLSNLIRSLLAGAAALPSSRRPPPRRP